MGQGLDFEFLTSMQIMLMLLVQVSHSEKTWLRLHNLDFRYKLFILWYCQKGPCSFRPYSTLVYVWLENNIYRKRLESIWLPPFSEIREEVMCITSNLNNLRAHMWPSRFHLLWSVLRNHGVTVFQTVSLPDKEGTCQPGFLSRVSPLTQVSL